MTTILNLKPNIEAENTQTLTSAGNALQERIDAMIAEAVKNAPPPLSVEEQCEKNQAAIELLREWREEDATDDPEEIAQAEAEWEKFKKSMNESHSSSRIIFP